jgi:hypothetical protein
MSADRPPAFDPVAALRGRRLVGIHGVAPDAGAAASGCVATLVLALDDGTAVQVGVGYEDRLGRLVFGPTAAEPEAAGAWAAATGLAILDVAVGEVLAQPPAPPPPPAAGGTMTPLEAWEYSGEAFAAWYFHDEDHPPRPVPVSLVLDLAGGLTFVATLHETDPVVRVEVREG